jgi:diguanylate cyclase (GGDEF)-like protein/PAS domain S-box-containing protein
MHLAVSPCVLRTAPAPIDAAAMLDLLPGLVSYFGHDLRYRYANQAYARWRGIDPAGMLGRHCRSIVGEDNYPLIAAKLREALSGHPVTYEYDLFDQGHCRHVQGSYQPDIAADGSVRGVLALVTDISVRHDLQRAIAESNAMFDQAFENSPIGMAMVDLGGHLLRVNPVFATMLGRSAAELAGVTFERITDPEDIRADLDLFAEVVAGLRNGYQMHKRYRRPDGGVVYAHLTVIAVRDEAGRPTRFIAQVEDVSEARAIEARIRIGVARLNLAVEALAGGFWHLDIASGVFETSRKLAQFVEGADALPLGLDRYVEHVDPDDMASAQLAPLIRGTVETSSAEYRLHTVAGMRWVRCDRRLVRNAGGVPEQVVGVVIDITRERESREAAEIAADTDALTDLLNRRGIMKRLARLDPAQPCGVLAIDLDGFKQVNDTFGHAAGDRVLAECARRLRRDLRTTDLVARLGGDEFLVVMPGMTREMLAMVAQRMAVALAEPLADAGRALPVHGSIGLAWADRTPADMAKMIEEADANLYRDKASRRRAA